MKCLECTNTTCKKTTVKERPIPFNSEMVNAILSGQKTQTRRAVRFTNYHPSVLEKQPDQWQVIGFDVYDGKGIIDGTLRPVYGKVGDILWVRETWCGVKQLGGRWVREKFHYKADEPELSGLWKPSIHMPREACRLRLEITDIRVERLQDISDNDAIAEGIKIDQTVYPNRLFNYHKNAWQTGGFPAVAFYQLWKMIYGEESFKSNPWVWVVEFKRLEACT